MKNFSRSGFTLIELLVVITIIVILLALLAPALDKAVYQAQLTVCSTQQKAVGQGAINYALDNKRYYPHRPAVENTESNWQAITLYHRPGGWGPYDDRPLLRPYMNINRMLNDPLTAAVDLENSDEVTSDVLGSISRWFGYRFKNEKGMFKMGDRWTFWNVTTQVSNVSNVLVSDRDTPAGLGNNPLLPGPGEQCSHPDRDGVLYNIPLQDGKSPWGGANLNLTMSLWLDLINPQKRRGLVDTNFTFQDLSVHRYADVTVKDERMAYVPSFVNKQDGGWQAVPKN